MSLMALIDYSSIVAFFVVAGVLVVAIGRPHQKNKAIAGSDKQHSVVYQEKATTYIALAVLCLFLVCLALATNKHSSA
jgi:hypothetical protein